MKIGVLDSDGSFSNEFFRDKKLKVIIDKRNWTESAIKTEFTHGEYVCSHIFKENPEAEINLVPIINSKRKCSVQAMIDGIQLLMECQVDMINLSIGDEYRYHPELEKVCQKAWEKGILMVAAHSNRENVTTYPAVFPFVLGISCKDEKEPIKIIRYDRLKNELLFSSSYFSLYHLGIPRLLSGNSFACARICGLLSHHTENYKIFLDRFINSILNIYYPYPLLKKKKCIFLTNRKGEPLEQRFIKEVTNTIKCLEFQKAIGGNLIYSGDYDVLFIDHSNYEEILPFKSLLRQHAVKEPNKELVLRYPLFNMEERFRLFNESGVMIHQFFV